VLFLKNLVPDYNPGAQLLKTAMANNSARTKAAGIEIAARKGQTLVPSAFTPTLEIS
jgi:hypothetical protein